jgi:hypothetical protein
MPRMVELDSREIPETVSSISFLNYNILIGWFAKVSESESKYNESIESTKTFLTIST